MEPSSPDNPEARGIGPGPEPRGIATPPREGAVAIVAHLAYHGRPSTPATAWVTEHGRPARVGGAIRILALCWGAAIASVFVPLGHFFLVPAFLIAGPVLAWGQLGERRTLVGAQGLCPGCGHAQSFDDHGRFAERFALRCAQCRREILLEPGAP